MIKCLLATAVALLGFSTAQIQFQPREQISTSEAPPSGQDLIETQVQYILDKYGGSRGGGCDCTTIEDCTWASDAVFLAKTLPKTSPSRNGIITLLRNRACQGFKVRCCEASGHGESTEFGVSGNRRLNHHNSVRSTKNLQTRTEINLLM